MVSGTTKVEQYGRLRILDSNDLTMRRLAAFSAFLYLINGSVLIAEGQRVPLRCDRAVPIDGLSSTVSRTTNSPGAMAARSEFAGRDGFAGAWTAQGSTFLAYVPGRNVQPQDIEAASFRPVEARVSYAELESAAQTASALSRPAIATWARPVVWLNRASIVSIDPSVNAGHGIRRIELVCFSGRPRASGTKERSRILHPVADEHGTIAANKGKLILDPTDSMRLDTPCVRLRASITDGSAPIGTRIIRKKCSSRDAALSRRIERLRNLQMFVVPVENRSEVLFWSPTRFVWFSDYVPS